MRRYFESKDFQILKEILILFIGWRIIISLVGFLGLSFLPQVLEPGHTNWAGITVDYWLKWANWDGGHFRGIAEAGYIPFQVVFFPLYPILIKSLMINGIPSLWGGLIISNLSIIGALFYLYKLVNLDFEEKSAKKAIFIVLAFPTAFYFGAVYSESLFLLLTVGAFYYARQKSWLIALIFASLSAVTRLMGLVVILAVAVEYFVTAHKPPTMKEFWSEFLNRIGSYMIGLAFILNIAENFLTDFYFYTLAGLAQSTSYFLVLFGGILISVFILKFLFSNFNYRKIISAPSLFLILSFIPFLIYCLVLKSSQGSFFAFVQHEQLWHRHLTLPWDAPLSYFRNLWAVGFFQIGASALGLIEFIFFVIFITLLIISYFKLRLSYTLYFAISLLLPLSTGTLSAIHRYGLVIFPVFILLSLIKNETYYQLWIYFSLTLLGLLTVMFINSYWVT